MSESETSTGTLDEYSAGALLSSMFDATPQEETPKEEEKAVEPEQDIPIQEEVQEEAEADPEEEPKKFTIKVDGKDVEVSESELAEAYKSGLRQSDYTKKTMEVAEQRKAAEAEKSQAAQQREAYERKLQETQVILHNALAEQSQIDWNKLLEDDPIAFMREKHLFEQRQAALHQAQVEAQQINQYKQEEQRQATVKYLAEQQDNLLAKLPEWKDEAKATSEKTAIKQWMLDNGFSDKEVDGVGDHRAVLMARKAMLYDQAVAKAKAAAKKVEGLPAKVERPGVQESRTMDRRSSSWQRLNKTGKIDDAAPLLASFLT